MLKNVQFNAVHAKVEKAQWRWRPTWEGILFVLGFCVCFVGPPFVGSLAMLSSIAIYAIREKIEGMSEQLREIDGLKIEIRELKNILVQNNIDNRL